MAKANVTAPYQKAWSAGELVKVPTSGGSTGMIRPIDIMSISTVSMMKRMAAWRTGGSALVVVVYKNVLRESGAGPARAQASAIPCGSSALPW